MVRPVTEPCGTYAAARRHQRHGEPLDDACRDALREHQRAMYERRRARATAEHGDG
jgi:hypothetical protein